MIFLLIEYYCRGSVKYVIFSSHTQLRDPINLTLSRFDAYKIYEENYSIIPKFIIWMLI